jgi:hypothetical protein
MQRPFKAEIDGVSITGVVDKPDHQEITDYYVLANIADYRFKFRMIMVSSPPLYSVNMIEMRNIKDPVFTRIFTTVSREPAERAFELILTECLSLYRLQQNRSK